MRVARDATPVPAGRLETPDSSDLRESGVKSAPRGAWHRHRLHAVGEVDPDGCAELGTDRVTYGAWRARSRHSGGCGRTGRGVHRGGAGAGGVPPAEPMQDAE